MQYDKKEFAEKKGVTLAVVNAWIYKHALPVIQIGRKTYITEEDYDEWLASHKTTKTKEAAQQQPTKDYTPRNLHPKEGFLGRLRLAR